MKSTKKTKTIICISLVLVTVLVIAVVFIRKKAKETTENSDREEEKKAEDAINALESEGNNQSFPLVYNPHVKTELVKKLQSKLNDRLANWTAPLLKCYREDGTEIKSLKVDGYFGKETLAVVKYVWQGKTQVTEDMFNSL